MGLALARRVDRLETSQARHVIANLSGDLSFRDYIGKLLPNLPWYWHMELMADELQSVVEGETTRLMAFAPPRYFKSLFFSRLAPAYQLYRDPSKWAGLACAAADLARDLSKDARSFYEAGGGVFRLDSKDASLWRTLSGGGMWARGIRGRYFGLGFDLCVVDDPSPDYFDATSTLKQKRLEDWFWKTLYNRRRRDAPAGQPKPRPAIVVMHQRLAELDLVGRLLKREEETEDPENWRILNLPALCRPREYSFPKSCEVAEDPRAEGEPLCEALDTAKDLDALERKDAATFAAMYQQEPLPDSGGGVFERGWFIPVGDAREIEHMIGEGLTPIQIVRELQAADVLPEFVQLVRGHDIAASERRQHDATASTLGGLTEGGEIYWLDCTEDHIGAGKVTEHLLNLGELDGQGVEQAVTKEPGGAGKILKTNLVDGFEAMGLMVHEVETTGSKRVRAIPHAGAANPGRNGDQGRVYALRAPWLPRFVEQHHRFDGAEGGEDDIVDAAAYTFAVLDVLGGRPFIPWSRRDEDESDEDDEDAERRRVAAIRRRL